MRTHYRNGDEITLTHCGCDGCTPSTINGVICHEHGCMDAWRDRLNECRECGCDFSPSERGQRVCGDCLADDEHPEILHPTSQLECDELYEDGHMNICCCECADAKTCMMQSDAICG